MATRRSIPVSLLILQWTFKALGHVAPKLGAKLMYRLWLSSPKYPEPPRERFWRESSVQSSLNTQYGKIAVYQWGDHTKPIIVLMHGWSGRGTQLAHFTKMLIDAGYSVMAFDAPGHGRSPGKSTDLVQMSDTLNQVATHYGQPYAIIAHSFGVLVTAYSLASRSIQIKKIVCLSSPITPSYLVDRFASILQIPTNISSKFRKYFEKNFGEDLWTRFAADENAKQLSMPALIIHDDKDDIVDWHISEKLAAAWPDAEFVKTSGYGHRRILRSQPIANMIQKFLK